MSRREWPLRFTCGHPGCTESANYRYATRRDMMESFERRNYSDGRWRCVRHTRPDEVLSLTNPRTRAEIVIEQKPHGKYFGHSGFIFGLGFKAFAADFPEGTTIIVSAEVVLPCAERECPSSPNGRHQVDTSMESGPSNCFHCERTMP